MPKAQQVTESRLRDFSSSEERSQARQELALVMTDELPGPKGRIPRDLPQRESGNGGRALVDSTGYVGGEARDAAMSRVRETLDLQSG